VPWDQVEVVDGGRVEQPDEERAVVRGPWVRAVSDGLNAMLNRPGKLARRERTLRFAREAVPELLVVRREPRLAFRLPADSQNYAYLGQARKESARENWPLLMADVRRHAGGAMTPGAIALAEGDGGGAPSYPTSEALLEHATLELLRRWYRRDRDREGAEGTAG
jgi:hypothetical protein